MSPDWTPLTRELNIWSTDGLSLPLWWRDDDAIAPTAALDRLQSLALHRGIPLHLAIIPATAKPELAHYTRDRTHICPVVHGWAHKNHAPRGEKKAEFGATRLLEDLVEDADAGLRRMQALFGSQLAPMFVPPWNRVSDSLIEPLSAMGFRAVSTFKARECAWAAPNLCRVNTHVDPINWKADGALHDPDSMILEIARMLTDRRTGRADNEEPLGVLTHHLVHDDSIQDFVGELMARLCDAPVSFWRADVSLQRTGEQHESA